MKFILILLIGIILILFYIIFLLNKDKRTGNIETEKEHSTSGTEQQTTAKSPNKPKRTIRTTKK